MNNKPRNPDLSVREKQVLEILATGKFYKEIATELNISIDTVKKHCKSIYKKLKVKSRAEAAIHVMREEMNK